MKLIDRKGVAHEVDIGLVDKQGAFFLLLDSNETCEYLRFSDEAQALTELHERNEKLERKLKLFENPEHWKANGGLVTQGVAAQLIGASAKTVQRLLDEGKLKATMVGTSRKVSLSAIEYYLRYGEESPNETAETLL